MDRIEASIRELFPDGEDWAIKQVAERIRTLEHYLLKSEVTWIVRDGRVLSSSLNQVRMQGPFQGASDRSLLQAHDRLFGTHYLDGDLIIENDNHN